MGKYMGMGRGTEFDRSGIDSLVVELVSLISEAKDTEPLELPPLADTIDPEAVERVLESDMNDSVTVSFEYVECEVVVTGNGEIFVLSSR